MRSKFKINPQKIPMIKQSVNEVIANIEELLKCFFNLSELISNPAKNIKNIKPNDDKKSSQSPVSTETMGINPFIPKMIPAINSRTIAGIRALSPIKGKIVIEMIIIAKTTK